MWRDHSFSQRSKATKRAEREGVGQNLKKGGSQYRVGLHKIGEGKNPLPTMVS